MTSVDERYLHAAENELYGELSVILGIFLGDRNEMEMYIEHEISGKN